MLLASQTEHGLAVVDENLKNCDRSKSSFEASQSEITAKQSCKKVYCHNDERTNTVKESISASHGNAFHLVSKRQLKKKPTFFGFWETAWFE
jgi:hypothetical protein